LLNDECVARDFNEWAAIQCIVLDGDVRRGDIDFARLEADKRRRREQLEARQVLQLVFELEELFALAHNLELQVSAIREISLPTRRRDEVGFDTGAIEEDAAIWSAIARVTVAAQRAALAVIITLIGTTKELAVLNVEAGNRQGLIEFAEGRSVEIENQRAAKLEIIAVDLELGHIQAHLQVAEGASRIVVASEVLRCSRRRIRKEGLNLLQNARQRQVLSKVRLVIDGDFGVEFVAVDADRSDAYSGDPGDGRRAFIHQSPLNACPKAQCAKCE